MTSHNAAALASPPQPSDLTIALCTIGRDGYLQTALQSLIDTTPAGVSLHIVLNCPEDPSIVDAITEQIATWDGPHLLTVLDERLTIAGSHSTALNNATTNFITFMGDDDLVLEPRVERILDLFWTYDPTPAVIGSFCRRVTGPHDAPRFATNKDYGPTSIEEWETARDSDNLIEVVFPSAIYRTDLLRSVGGFEERFGSAMDLATFTMLGMLHPVLADPRRSFAHRIHDGSVTSSSAAQHAVRLQYTEACVAAVRAGTEQPAWQSFIDSGSAAVALSRRRQTVSGTLFRQGGAAAASGHRLSGLIKIAGSAIVSPSTFARRSKAQVARPESGQPVVSILLKNTNQYRLALYETLRIELAKRDIELRLVVADGLREDHAKGDRATLPWAEERPFREISVLGKKLLWQPGFDVASGADLIITEQASKQLFNIVLAYGQRGMRTRLAFWGHGKNFQSSIEGSSGEGLKNRLTRKAHWFFAYNELSAKAAEEAGMPADRITAVMNATDTDHIRAVHAGLPANSEKLLRTKLAMGEGPVVLSMGGIYPPKRPAFLIESALHLRTLVPDVEVLVIGGGSDQHLVEEAAATNDWIHAVGPIYGDDRIAYAALASLQVMPGMVGLNIVDGFGLGLPTVTTDIDYHSPEIDYLVNEVNGLRIDGTPTAEEFAQGVAALLNDPDRLAKMQAAAYEAGLTLTTSQMAEKFADGVVAALAAPSR